MEESTSKAVLLAHQFPCPIHTQTEGSADIEESRDQGCCLNSPNQCLPQSYPHVSWANSPHWGCSPVPPTPSCLSVHTTLRHFRKVTAIGSNIYNWSFQITLSIQQQNISPDFLMELSQQIPHMSESDVSDLVLSENSWLMELQLYYKIHKEIANILVYWKP
jgi:hypothetical protein